MDKRETYIEPEITVIHFNDEVIITSCSIDNDSGPTS